MATGFMEVQLVKAKGLRDTDIFGKMDPYVLIQYKGQEKRSRVARGQGKNPVWNEQFMFKVDYVGSNDQHKLIFKIMDKDLYKDDFVGEAIIHVGDLLAQGVENGGAKLQTLKYRVVRANKSYCGEIDVGVTFTPKVEDKFVEEEIGGWKVFMLLFSSLLHTHSPFFSAMNAIATASALSLPIFLRASKFDTKRDLKCRFKVFAVYGEEDKKNSWGALFDVEDPRSKITQNKGKVLDVYQALEVARHDIQYLDWRARQDVLTIMLLHEKVVEVLNPLAREFKSIGTLKKELAGLQDELEHAHRQVHISEARVTTALDKLAYMEELVNDKLLQDRSPAEISQTSSSPSTSANSVVTEKRRQPRKNLNISGPVQSYHPHLKNFWYPVAFSSNLKDDTMIPIECFEEPWVIFRGKDGKPGCVQNTCAHRACPLHLGSVNEGRIQCPYHGWEYTTDGKCEKMPSTRLLNVKIKSVPCFEKEGMIWIWPGNEPPTATLPSLLPPSGFEIHAEIVMELPIEHGLLLDNLLDLAHAPFTHTSTFAKGWSVPSLVKFLTPASGLQGYWDPYPIDMEFRPPCMVLSTIGISKPGKLEGQNTRECSTHLHQLHVCLPSSKQKTRLLYRMSLDFAPLLKHIPLMQYLWKHFAEQVLNEDLRLVVGQQERMNNGANVWNFPVSYDKLGVRYRLWRDALERGDKQLPFTS